jgi:hypothetical protein
LAIEATRGENGKNIASGAQRGMIARHDAASFSPAQVGAVGWTSSRAEFNRNFDEGR